MGVLEKVKKLVSGSTHRDAFSDIDREELSTSKAFMPPPVLRTRIVWVSFQYKRPTQVELLETDRNIDHLKKRLKAMFPRHLGHLEAFEFGLKIHPDAREIITEDLLLSKLKVGHDAASPLYIWLPCTTTYDNIIWNIENDYPRRRHSAGSPSGFVDGVEHAKDESLGFMALSPCSASSEGPCEPPAPSDRGRQGEDLATEQAHSSRLALGKGGSPRPQSKHPDLLRTTGCEDGNPGRSVHPVPGSVEPGQRVPTAAAFYQHSLAPEDVAWLLQDHGGGLPLKRSNSWRPDRAQVVRSHSNPVELVEKNKSTVRQYAAEGQRTFESLIRQQMTQEKEVISQGSIRERTLPTVHEERRPRRSIFMSSYDLPRQRCASMDGVHSRDFARPYNCQPSDISINSSSRSHSEQQQHQAQKQRSSFWSAVLKGGRWTGTTGAVGDAPKGGSNRTWEKVSLGRPRVRRTKSLEITDPILDVSAPVPLVLQKEAELNPSFYAFLMQAKKQQIPGLLSTSPSSISVDCDDKKQCS